jgi:hypothetical protein
MASEVPLTEWAGVVRKQQSEQRSQRAVTFGLVTWRSRPQANHKKKYGGSRG